MAISSEKLANSLKILKGFQDKGVIAINSSMLTRTNRERLVKAGFLQEVMKGWYVPAMPHQRPGDTTAWYASYWDFCAAYFNSRFKTKWCLSPEQSVLLHTGNKNVPPQLIVRSPLAQNTSTTLLHNTSFFEAKLELPGKQSMVINDKLRLYSLPAALVQSPANFYTNYPIDAMAALLSLQDATEILGLLLEGGQSVVAGRLAGAIRNVGRPRLADDIIEAMRAAGYSVRENNPFSAPMPVMPVVERSPYVNRIRLLWMEMRQPVLSVFPKAPGLPENIDAYLKNVDEVYKTDAYNSLSIEGYRVSEALIEKVRTGNWDTKANEEDKKQRDALAARGYWQAFQQVKRSLEAVLGGADAGDVADKDHGKWYREMFAPSVTAGIIKASDLAGYRNHPVFISNAWHVPPPPEAVRDVMPAFFNLLTNEREASVRVVLGHYFFVYIHPYTDGNGRMGRFLMNVMLASGGYPWTVVPLIGRDRYMQALDAAGSESHDIKPFAQFIAELVNEGMK